MNKALLSSRKMDWCTPQDFFDKLDEEFHFVLDAAATDKTAKCDRYFTPETDGLSQSWDCGGAVFCNPPYGRQVKKWVKKAYEESCGGGILLSSLLPRGQIQGGFMTTYMVRQKSDSSKEELNLQTTKEMPHPQRHFHQ